MDRHRSSWALTERRRRITVPRVVVFALSVVLPLYAFWGAPNLAPPAVVGQAPASPQPPPSPTRPGHAGTGNGTLTFPPEGKSFIGISVTEPDRGLRTMARFRAATRHAPQVVQFFRAWEGDTFDRTLFDHFAGRGALPMLSWEPWDPPAASRRARNQSDQPRYRLTRIVDGDFDPYIAEYARGVRALPYRVAIRFAHEMNGHWYPWGARANGNRPGDYVAAFRHVREVFRALGADNVIWVWSPHVGYPGGVPLRTLYPGGDAVDWVGLSGYYGGQDPRYIPFTDVFGPALAAVREFTGKPIVLTEVGATDETGRKADWIRSMFRALDRIPDVIGLIWFEVLKEKDWRIATSPAASAAFAAGAADRRYHVRWTPGAMPRTSGPR